MAETQDRRVRRTRNAVIEAFNRLVLRRERDIRVQDIVEEADIGRSTFYEHYANADDVHMQALSRPLAILADALTEDGAHEKLPKFLAHFWDNRQRARQTFCGAEREKVSRLLAEMVEKRLEAAEAATAMPRPFAAAQLAELGLAPIRGWLMAEAPMTVDALADAILRSAEGLRAAIIAPGQADQTLSDPCLGGAFGSLADSIDIVTGGGRASVG